ncbi:MAG: LysR family transcriptional regulator [Breznakia sp.]
MNATYFEYIVEIDRTRSITQAAENLFMAQPNLSKALKETEQQIGFPIFERSSKGVIPTRRGEEFLVHARAIVNQMQKITQLSKTNDDRIQRFSISIPRGSYISNAFTYFLSELDIEKGYQIDMVETNSMQTIQNVISGVYPLGIIRYQMIYENYFLDYLKDKKLIVDTIWEMDHLVYMSKEHPLVDKKNLREEELKGFVEISHGDTTIPYLFTERVEAADTDLDRRIYVHDRFNQFNVLQAIPSSYMWGSALPRKILDRYGLVQRRCESKRRKYKDILIYSEEYKLTTLDLKFIDRLYAARNKVAFRKYD